MHKFPYKWRLSDGYPAKGIEKHAKTVFTTFACGGGSTMGYKLAGFDVIGANDIDPQMEKVYKANHNPKHFYLSDVRTLIDQEFPEEFYNLDLLDGSPPCSTFSLAGSREKAWGKEKVFREGQAKQVLDDLFFEFIELTKKLQPKTFVAENVKGMLVGNAKGYVKEIVKKFDEAGYDTQLFLLNAATMGVPQRRERVFFVGVRKDLKKPKLVLNFNEPPIPFSDIEKHIDYSKEEIKPLTPLHLKYWNRALPGQSVGKFKSKRKIKRNEVLSTIDANHDGQYHYSVPRQLLSREYILGGSYPEDYNFLDIRPKYLIGMSVPPVMTAQVASEIYRQWLL